MAYSATAVEDWDSDKPVGASESVSIADDAIREIKKCVENDLVLEAAISVLIAAEATLPVDYISGLVLSLDTDTDHDVNVTAGEARDAPDAEDIVLASEITKRIDAGWSVGDDAGGMDTGAVGNNLHYAVWLIKRSDTGVEDVLFSLSFTAPTMPADYDIKRKIGWVLTNGSANIIGFRQMGTGGVVRYEFTARQLIASGLASTSPVSQAVNAIFPTAGMNVIKIWFGALTAGGTARYGLGYDASNIMASASAKDTGNGANQYAAVGNYSSPRAIQPNGNTIYYVVESQTMTLYGLGCVIQR